MGKMTNFRPLTAGKRACTWLSVFYKLTALPPPSPVSCVHCPHSLWTASSLPQGVTTSSWGFARKVTARVRKYWGYPITACEESCTLTVKGQLLCAVLTPPHTVLPLPAVLPLLLLPLSHSHPSSGRARVIIFFLQAPFKFSLFKFRINLPFVLALAIKLESSPEITLIKKKGGDILISIPSIVLRAFVVSLRCSGRFGQQINTVLQQICPISSRKETHVGLLSISDFYYKV